MKGFSSGIKSGRGEAQGRTVTKSYRLARLVNQQVKIDGDLDMRTESIKARNIYAAAADKSWKKVWAKDVTDDIYRDVLGFHPLLSGNWAVTAWSEKPPE